jgi:hypothetical protein
VTSRKVWFVVPGDVDDDAAPSGGNVYAAADVGRLGRALDAVPAGAVVLLDGLVGCAVPELLEAQAGRLALVVLVHLPLADETGLTPAAAPDPARRHRWRAAAAARRAALPPWEATLPALAAALDVAPVPA